MGELKAWGLSVRYCHFAVRRSSSILSAQYHKLGGRDIFVIGYLPTKRKALGSISSAIMNSVN